MLFDVQGYDTVYRISSFVLLLGKALNGIVYLRHVDKWPATLHLAHYIAVVAFRKEKE